MRKIFEFIIVAGVIAIAFLYVRAYGVPAVVDDFLDRPSKLDAIETAAPASKKADAPAPKTESQAPAPRPSVAASGGIEANARLRMNNAGLDIIKRSEGLRLEAYSSGGRSYIGYGHQMAPGEPRTITEAQATALLRADVRGAEDGVRARLTRPATENEFSAMVSLAYNLGMGNFSRSPVLANFNEGRKMSAADAFLGHNRAGGRVLEHLTHRREEERALFLTP